MTHLPLIFNLPPWNWIDIWFSIPVVGSAPFVSDFAVLLLTGLVLLPWLRMAQFRLTQQAALAIVRSPVKSQPQPPTPPQ